MGEPKQNINYTNSSNKVVSLEKGKLPPQAMDLEEAILGAALQDKYIIDLIIEIFRDEKVFYKAAHQVIYDAMYEMAVDSQPIDMITVIHKLKTLGKLEAIGGEFYIVELTQKVSSSAHTEYHCRIVMQMHVKRQSIRVANDIIERSYNEETDIFDLLDASQKEMDDVSQWLIRKKPTEFKNVVDSVFDSSENNEAGVPSSLAKLQKKLNGYREEDLIIVAARPGMGKTALMLSEAKHMAKLGHPVAIFSLEMSDKDLVRRMLAEECGIDSSKITLNRLSQEEKDLMAEKRPEFEKLPIYIHDQAGLTPMELRGQASRWKREKGIKMIYVDYLQLMNASGKNHTGNREQEISSISRSLKATAKELGVPVMALSQLSRAVETRGGYKRPILSDLRESGAIEQDADVIMFLLRPEYYKIFEWDDDSRSSCRDQAEIGVAKFRGGETGACIVGCNLKYMRFFDLEEEDDFFDSLPVPPNQNPEEAFEPVNDSALPEEDDDMPF